MSGGGRYTVYRLYDGTGQLLYVGCTSDYSRRMANHSCTSAWFHAVANCERTLISGRDAARALEREQIRNLHPLYNDHHQSEHTLAAGERSFTVEGFAAHLGVTHRTVQRWLDDGVIQGLRLDGPPPRWRIPESQLQRTPAFKRQQARERKRSQEARPPAVSPSAVIIRENAGRLIRQQRGHLGLSLAEVAHRVGYSGAYISLIELGRTLPKQEMLIVLCRELGLPAPMTAEQVAAELERLQMPQTVGGS